MTFPSTYAEYRWLREQHGWYKEGGMIRAVWNNCTPEAQEDMLNQLRSALKYKDRYVAQHGDVW